MIARGGADSSRYLGCNERIDESDVDGSDKEEEGEEGGERRTP